MTEQKPAPLLATPTETSAGDVARGLPTTDRAARAWVRRHWADLIGWADMGGAGDLQCDAIDRVWSDECRRIAARLDPGRWRPQTAAPAPADPAPDPAKSPADAERVAAKYRDWIDNRP